MSSPTGTIMAMEIDTDSNSNNNRSHYPYNGNTPQSQPQPRVMPTYYRPLSNNELSYFLPSRADGVNDMILHVGFKAPSSLVSPLRVGLVWAIMRLRHPLLAARVEMEAGNYDSPRFAYTPPSSPSNALSTAQTTIQFHSDRSIAVIQDAFLNGPRLLSASRSSFLQVLTYSGHRDYNRRDAFDGGEEDIREYDLVFAATHYAGDGVGTHMCMNLIFALLGATTTSLSSNSNSTANANSKVNGKTLTDAQLAQILASEWNKQYGRGSKSMTSSLSSLWSRGPTSTDNVANVLAPSTETRLGLTEPSKLEGAARKLDFQNSQARSIGGQVFPRTQSTHRRHNVVTDITFTRAQTALILAKCRKEGVTVQNAIFALCNFAWIRCLSKAAVPTITSCGLDRTAAATEILDMKEVGKLPMMMYTAINLRPYFPKPTTSSTSVISRTSSSLTNGTGNASNMFLALAYCNIVLPSFIPTPSSSPLSMHSHSSCACQYEDARKNLERKVFWGRARSVKSQMGKYLGSPMLGSRTAEMCKERGERSKRFAKEDDEIAAGLRKPFVPAAFSPSIPTSASAFSLNPAKLPPAPSAALIGLSQLGELDGAYPAQAYPSIQLTQMTCSTRKGKGGILLFSHTFRGQLYLTLGWDREAFKEGVIEGFWDEVNGGVGEFMIGPDGNGEREMSKL